MNTIHVTLDGELMQASTEQTVLALLINAGLHTRCIPPLANSRFALCGMGICQDCAVEIDGKPAQLACLNYCRDGMRVRRHV